MTETSGSPAPTGSAATSTPNAADDTASNSGAPTPAFPPTSSGNRSTWLAALLVFIVVVALLIAFVGALRHWFAIHTGTLTPAGGPQWYNFWSGFGSDLGEATLISAVCVGVYTGVRKVNCHTKGCWRIGHHQLEGTPFILCRHHHPEVPNGGASHDAILREHHRVRLEKEAEKLPRANS